MSFVSESKKTTRTLVSFSWEGGAVSWNVTNANVSFPTFLGVFQSDSSMEVDLPPYAPTFVRSVAKITLDINTNFAFLSKLVGAQIHSPVEVSILEMFDSPSGTGVAPIDLRYRFRGRLTSAENNVDGRKGRMRVEVISEAGDFDIPMGLLNAEECVSPFGHPSLCKLDLSLITTTHTIQTVSNRQITVSNVPNTIPEYYTNGRVSYRGINIKITSRTDASTFILASYPPVEWVSADVQFVPGCDKTRYFCSAVHRNQENFSGYGVGRLARNPIYERD